MRRCTQSEQYQAGLCSSPIHVQKHPRSRLHLPDAEHLQVMGITKQIRRDKTYDDTHRKQHRVAKPPQGASECKRCTDRLEKAVKSSSQQNVTVQHDQLSQDADPKLPLMSQDVTRSGSGIPRNDKVVAQNTDTADHNERAAGYSGVTTLGIFRSHVGHPRRCFTTNKLVNTRPGFPSATRPHAEPTRNGERACRHQGSPFRATYSRQTYAHGITNGNTTAIEHANTRSPIAAFIRPACHAGNATRSNHNAFHAISKNSTGSIRNGFRNPNTESAHNAPSMHTTTPRIGSQCAAGSSISGQTVNPNPTTSNRYPARRKPSLTERNFCHRILS